MVYLLLGKLFNSVLNTDFQKTYRRRRHSSDLCVVHSVIAHYRNASEMTEIMVLIIFSVVRTWLVYTVHQTLPFFCKNRSGLQDKNRP